MKSSIVVYHGLGATGTIETWLLLLVIGMLRGAASTLPSDYSRGDLLLLLCIEHHLLISPLGKLLRLLLWIKSRKMGLHMGLLREISVWGITKARLLLHRRCRWHLGGPLRMSLKGVWHELAVHFWSSCRTWKRRTVMRRRVCR